VKFLVSLQGENLPCEELEKKHVGQFIAIEADFDVTRTELADGTMTHLSTANVPMFSLHRPSQHTNPNGHTQFSLRTSRLREHAETQRWLRRAASRNDTP